MLKTKANNAKINIPILILLLVIVIFGSILALKITGVIKPSEPKPVTNTMVNESNTNIGYSDIEEAFGKTMQTARIISTIISITIVIAAIALNIGICKLYQKLGLSNGIVIFNFIYPILSIIATWFSGFAETLFTLVAGIMGIITMVQYFKSVGMSGFWGILPIAAIMLMSIGAAALLFGGGSFIVLISLVMLVAGIIAYVISNIKLGRIFGKSTAFIVGLAILPFIFQPILGYGKSERIA